MFFRREITKHTRRTNSTEFVNYTNDVSKAFEIVNEVQK